MKKLSTRQKWLTGLILFTLTFIFLAITAYNKLQTTTVHPTDLGSRLEYIGQDHYGCVLWICDSPPMTEYYFATDMTREELKTYFKNATSVEVRYDSGGGSGHQFDDFTFTTGKSTLNVTYYRPDGSSDPFIVGRNLKTTTKPFIISIDERDFYLAKSAL